MNWLCCCCGPRAGKEIDLSRTHLDYKDGLQSPAAVPETKDRGLSAEIAEDKGPEIAEAKSPVPTTVSNFDEIDIYIYQPLASPEQIRILLLEPGSGDEEIQCSLVHTNVQSPVYHYTALSYTWGSVHDQKYVLCGGKKHKITANLYSALRRLRAKKYRFLWIDALSINQSQEPAWLRERENQVRLMGTIYSQARSVVVDLGEGSPDFELALDLVEDVAGREDAIPLPNKLGRSSPYDLTVYGLPPQGDAKWIAWARLLARPWFRRVWVIQEFALNSQVKMMCGDDLFDPMDLSRANDRLAPLRPHHQFTEPESRRLYNMAMENMSAFRTMVYYRDAYVNQKPRPLGPLVDITRKTEATDPRDKVYAILALRKYRQDSNFIISYSQSTVEVFFRFSRYLVEQDDVLSVLWSAKGPRTDAPSWSITPTPEDVKTRDSAIRRGDNSGFLFSAGGSLTPRAWITSDRNVLAVSGILFDNVLDVMEHKLSLRHLSGHEYLYAVVDWIREAFLWCHTRQKALQRYPDLKDAVYRSLNRDSTRERTRLEDVFLEAQKHPDSLTEKLWNLAIQGHKVPNELAHALRQENFEQLNVYEACEGKRFAVTVRGYLAVLHHVVGEGDEIAIVHGADVPFALRYNGDLKLYSFLRPCYVHGLMDGEAFDQGRESETIKLC